MKYVGSELSNTACSGQMSRRMWVHVLMRGLRCPSDTAQTTHLVTSAKTMVLVIHV